MSDLLIKLWQNGILQLGIWETIYMTLISTFFAYLIGLPVGLILRMTDRDGIHPIGWLNRTLGIIVNALRSIPFIILMVAMLPVAKFIIGTSLGNGAVIVMLVIAAATEADIAELESYEERQMFLEDLGLEESGVARLIKSAYKLLNLETFFTTGADETRAWTYLRGMKAPQTAGIIHTDFEKGFIRAEVIKYDDYVTLGSEKACRDAGKIGIEGKEYVVQDGDIMHFLFNV